MLLHRSEYGVALQDRFEYPIQNNPNFTLNMTSAVHFASSFISKAQFEAMRCNLGKLLDEESKPEQWVNIKEKLETGIFEPSMITGLTDIKHLKEIIEIQHEVGEKIGHTRNSIKKRNKEMQNAIASYERSNRYSFGVLNQNRNDNRQRDMASMAFLGKMMMEAFQRYPQSDIVKNMVVHYLVQNSHLCHQIGQHPILSSILKDLLQVEDNGNIIDRSLLKQFKIFLALPLNRISLRARDQLGRIVHQEIIQEPKEIRNSSGRFFFFIK